MSQYFSKVLLFVLIKHNADIGITINAINKKKILKITEIDSPKGTKMGYYNPR